MLQKCHQAINRTVTTVNNEKNTQYSQSMINTGRTVANPHTYVSLTHSVCVFSDELTDKPYKKLK